MQQISPSSYRDLTVWKKAIELVMAVYECTDLLPKEETYGLISQMRRAAVSIPSNIAEGNRRGSRKEYILFLRYAFGSGAELETQLQIAKLLPKMKHISYERADALLDEIMRMLNVMIQKFGRID